MKKIAIIIGVLILISCSNNDDFVASPQLSNSTHDNEIRSYKEALQVAESAIDMLNGSNVTRSSSERRIDMNESKIYLKTEDTRSSSNLANDTLMYVFNYADNEGFAIVAAPKSKEALIAVTEKGHYTPGEPSGIEGFDMFMQLAEEYIVNNHGNTKDGGEPIDTLLNLSTTMYDYLYVGPYVSVRWGQTYPEGEFCPNGISGCTNTAMSQIMSYFEYPSSITLTYPERDQDTQVLNWANMKQHPTGHSQSYIFCMDLNAHKAIGRIHRQLGYMNQSIYNPSTTATYTMTYVPSTFSSLGYTVGTFQGYNSIYVHSELDNGHIFIIKGSTMDNIGHAWVLDGYHKITEITTFYKYSNGHQIIDYTTTVFYYYNHMNWGWYGNCNGYFSENVYNTANAYQYDTNNNTVSRNYCNNLAMMSVYVE